MRRRLKFYLDTSVFGSLFDFDDPTLISWNYRHMVNLKVKRAVNAINLKLGYRPIEILSPEEVIGYGEMES